MFADFNPSVWGARLALACALVLAGMSLGWSLGREARAGGREAEARKLATAAAHQQAATDQAVTQFIDAERIRSVAHAALEKDIRDETAADLLLPAAYRVLHDAAVLSAVPGAAGAADARPVSAQDLAATVAANYAACEANRQQLIALQAWVRSQQAIASR